MKPGSKRLLLTLAVIVAGRHLSEDLPWPAWRIAIRGGAGFDG